MAINLSIRTLVTISKIQIVLMGLMSIVMLAIPYCETYWPGDDDAGWRSQYIFSDFYLLIFYVPYFLCWILYFSIKRRKVKKLTGYFVIGFCVLQFINTAECLSFPMQDFIPSYGLFLSFLLSLTAFSYFLNNRLLGRRVKMPVSLKDLFTY